MTGPPATASRGLWWTFGDDERCAAVCSTNQVRSLPLRAASISAPTVSGLFLSIRSRCCEGENQSKVNSVGSDRKNCVKSNSETSIEHRLEISPIASAASSPSIPRSCKSRDSNVICFASIPDFRASTSNTHSIGLASICLQSLSLPVEWIASGWEPVPQFPAVMGFGPWGVPLPGCACRL